MNALTKGDLGHLDSHSKYLPKMFFEVEAYTPDNYTNYGRFSDEQEARGQLAKVKSTTLKHIVCWVRPAPHQPHQIKWTSK